MIGCSCPSLALTQGRDILFCPIPATKIAIALRIIKKQRTYNVKDYTELHRGAQGRHQVAELAGNVITAPV